MKILSILTLLAFLCSSCEKVEKDVKNYYPSVKTVSAKILPDGTIEVIGAIISPGTTPIEVAGFSADTSHTPIMQNMQILATFFTTDSFYSIYSGLQTDTKYYFRAWAGNEKGYSYGNTIYFNNISEVSTY